MTGIEVIGAVLVIGMLTGAITSSTTDTATKTKVSLMSVEIETSREKDVDRTTERHLNQENVNEIKDKLEALPIPAFPNP